MLDIIISSKTRINLLIKFFLFDGNQSYLRMMEREFKESTNAIRVELNKFSKAGLLTSEYRGKKRFYKANTKHPLYEDLKSLVRKAIGIDQINKRINNQLTDLESAYITGSFAIGVDSDIIELALIGHNLDKLYIDKLVKKTEKLIDRRIMYLTFAPDQQKHIFKNQPAQLIWSNEK